MKEENEMTKQRSNASPKRPIIITVFCVIAFIVFSLSLFALPTLLDLFSTYYGGWFVPIWIGQALLTLISILGYWRMQKWGVYLYTALFVIGTIMGLLMQVPFTIMGVIVPLIIIAIGFYYLKHMR